MYSRITNELMTRNLLGALNQTEQAQNDALTQVETQQRVNTPSDDPVAASLYSVSQAQDAQASQFLQNINSINGQLQVGDSALSSATTLLNRAITLGTSGANGGLTAADRTDLAGEVAQISQQMLNIANTTFNGVYIFAGTATGPAYAANAAQPDGVQYNGNTGVNQVQIAPGIQLDVNKPGSQVFQNAGGSVFQALHDLQTALSGNDQAGAQTAVGELDSALNAMGEQRVFYGSTINRLSDGETFLNNEKLDIAKQQNTLIGADLATAITQLSSAETARSAILAAGGKISQLSLINFLSP